MISAEIKEKFKKLYKEKFNISLSDEEATIMTTDLVNLVKVLLKPRLKPNAVMKLPREEKDHETVGIYQY